MPREAGLFEKAKGSAVKGYLLIKKQGANIPPMWIDRAQMTRKNKQKDLVDILKKKNLHGLDKLEDWELSFEKECFYHGIRVLLDLERNGKTKF